MKKLPLLFLVLLLLAFSACENSEKLLLHVPSPEWEDQIVYFIMTDRFFDGNPNNNELGTGEYDPTSDEHFQGGDLVGIQQQLDYIENLGATAIWITPPVWNQWWNPEKNFTGYHGYWASHFEKVDPHYGNLEDYKNLSDALHRRDMYLIQDVVTNHVGDWMRYEREYDPTDVGKNFVSYGAPEQSPFDLNDPTKKEHRDAAIYHFTPNISDYKNPVTRLTHQMSNLDDLNTKNPKVIETLIKAYQYWIEVVGVDGYRFDTAVYVDHEFWHKFMHGGQGELEGIAPFAKALGREKFYTFGETWIAAERMDDAAEQELQTYLGTKEKPEMDAVLNFPLTQSIKRVFANGEPTKQMTYRLETLEKYFPNSSGYVNFIDNHDGPRFRTFASEESYQQAMLFMMSIPGMPVIYQGTEQGEMESRPALFEKLNPTSSAFTFVKKLIDFRKKNPLTRRGRLDILADSDRCPGLLVYRLEKEGEELYAAFNTNDHTVLTSDVFVKNDSTLNGVEMIFSLREGSEVIVEKGHIKNLLLQPKEGVVFKIKKEAIDTSKGINVRVFNPMGVRVKTPIISARGSAAGADSAFIMLDGNMDSRMPADLKGNIWESSLDLKNTYNGAHFWQGVAVKDGQYYMSPKIKFTLDLEISDSVIVKDKIGDDVGPTGKYKYPSDPTFSNPTMDIKKVSAYARGNNLRLEVEMADSFSTVWNPFNGFDHLILMAYVDLPEKKGTNVLQKLNLELQKGEEWDFSASAFGWGLSGEEVDEDGDVTAIATKPLLEVIPEKNTIVLGFTAKSLGNPTSIKGAKIRLYTWDSGGENGLRPLAKEAEGFTFGGGEEDDPKYMDEVVLELE